MGFKRALEIIRDNQVHNPRRFAELAWPDSPCWTHVHKVGHGASRGAMMAVAGGGLLGKLRAKGLIRTPRYNDYVSYYSLTEEGVEYLKMYSTLER